MLGGFLRPYKWPSEANRQVPEVLKDHICSKVVLTLPVDNAPYRLKTDASGYAAGAVLHQVIGGQPHPLGFFSKTCSRQKFDL